MAVFDGPLSGDLDWGDAVGTRTEEDLDSFGNDQLAVGDLDGDGYDDLVYTSGSVGDAAILERAWVFTGPMTGRGDLGDAVAEVSGLVQVATAITAVAVGDIDGDGKADLALGAPDASNVYLLYGPVTGERAMPDDADTTWSTAGSRNGTSVSLGPQDADGRIRLLGGDYWGASSAGMMYLMTFE